MLCATAAISISASERMIPSDPFLELTEMRCTCYIDSGTMASGQQTRPYVMAAKKEWMGCVAALYDINPDGSVGEFIGYFEILDTGAGIDTDGDGKGDSIPNGTSVDVWMPSMADAKAWVSTHGDYVYLKLFKGEG